MTAVPWYKRKAELTSCEELHMLHDSLKNCRKGIVQCDLLTGSGGKQYYWLKRIEANILKDIENEQVRSLSDG